MADEKKLKELKVQGTGSDHKVVLWERNNLQPNGEVMVVNDGVICTVADTPLVRQAIAEGKITTEVDESKAPKATLKAEEEEDGEEEEDDETATSGVFSRGERPEIKRRGRPPKNGS